MRRRDWQHSSMTVPSVENSRSPSDDGVTREEGIAAEATAWFVRMTSDLVTDADRRDFETWLAQDPDHPEAYAEAEALWDTLEELPDLRGVSLEDREIPLSPPAKGEAASPRRPGRPNSRRAIDALRGSGLAACLLLAALLGVWGVGLSPGDAYDTWRADHATALGELRSVSLPDGSLVHLNGDTALAVDFTENRRRIVFYRGEAFFVVASDRQRPFEVAVGDGFARVLGTSFNLRAIADRVEVAVVKGRVEVGRRPPEGRSSDRQSGGDSVTLAAGQAAGYDAGQGVTGVIETLSRDLAAVTAWRQGRLVFADRPLRAVIAELDRHRPGRIVFLDPTIAQERFTGVLSLGDTDLALTAIETTLPVDALRVTPWLTLLRARD